MSITFFDCGAMIGKRRIINPGSFYETNELLRKMEFYRIAKALVCHSMCAYHQQTGNAMLAEEIKDIPQLEGVWVAVPHHAGDFPHPAQLREDMKTHGIKALRIYPSQRDHSFGVDDWHSGDLFAMLEETRAPLFVDLNQLSWGDVRGILTNHPQLRLVITRLHYNCGRHLYPLLDKFEHLYIESIGMKIFAGLEDICRRFGAERILFGSAAPLHSGGAAVGMVMYADISDEEKTMIAGKNLERLLGEVRL